MAENNNKQVQEVIYTFELPCGVKDEKGVTHKEIDLVEMSGLVDEMIARPDIRSNIGKVVGAVIGVCLRRIGTLTPQSMGAAKWNKMIQNMYMGDRDFIMLKLRVITYGDELDLDLQCPHCDAKFQYIVEIENDIEIKDLTGEPDHIPFELPRGLKNKDDVLVTEGIMGLPTGFDQEQMDQMLRKNPGQANTALLTRAVRELGNIELSSMIIREMNKRDREYLLEHLTQNLFGPKLSLDINCPECSQAFATGVNPVNFL